MTRFTILLLCLCSIAAAVEPMPPASNPIPVKPNGAKDSWYLTHPNIIKKHWPGTNYTHVTIGWNGSLGFGDCFMVQCGNDLRVPREQWPTVAITTNYSVVRGISLNAIEFACVRTTNTFTHFYSAFNQ